MLFPLGNRKYGERLCTSTRSSFQIKRSTETVKRGACFYRLKEVIGIFAEDPCSFRVSLRHIEECLNPNIILSHQLSSSVEKLCTSQAEASLIFSRKESLVSIRALRK